MLPPVQIRGHLPVGHLGLAAAYVAETAGHIRHATACYTVRACTRARLVNGTLSVRSLFHDERLQLIGNPVSVHCGTADVLSADHLVLLVRGGNEGVVDLVTACRTCYGAKRDRNVMVWSEEQGWFPPLMFVRRYLKLAGAWCEQDDLMEVELDDPLLATLPYPLDALPPRSPHPADLRL